MRLLITASILLQLSCLSAQRKILKQAIVYEEADLYAEAAEQYMKALYKDATKPDSKQGLKRNAQKVVNEMLANYFQARNSNAPEDAIHQFESMLNYQEKLSYFDVTVVIPPYYYQDYQDDLIKIKDKKRKEKARQAIFLADSLYQNGKTRFNAKQYTTAWEYFSSLLEIKSDYKETQFYMDSIIEKCSNIAIIPGNLTSYRAEESFRLGLIAEISKLKNPLIRLINRDQLAQLIEEQKLGLSGIIDEQSAAELGRILGAEIVVITQLINRNFAVEPVHTIHKIAYRASNNSTYDPSTKTTGYQTNYSPVSYEEVHQANRVQLSLHYQLVSVETAEILKADIINGEYMDRIKYATCTSNHQALYPSNGTTIYTKGKEREVFIDLFEGRKQLLTEKEMDLKILKVLSNEMANSIHQYFQ